MKLLLLLLCSISFFGCSTYEKTVAERQLGLRGAVSEHDAKAVMTYTVKYK